jgi:hypothetical protein
MCKLLVYFVTTIIFAGCAGQQGTGEPGGAKSDKEAVDTEKEQSADKSNDAPPAQPGAEPARMVQGPDGEMIPGMFKKGDGFVKSDEGASLPEGKIGLMKAARSALKSGRIDEAVAIADTLVILHADDAEILELRATVLDQKGDGEQAKIDFARCCELGRQSCCRDRDSDKDASD